jgi:DNA-directed RNA polymerase subunit RPC12/RpoP
MRMVASRKRTRALFNIDRIVHHDLYAYGLQFSVTWASDYWGVSRVIYVCMIVPAALSISMLAYDLVRNMKSKKRNDRQMLEKSMPVTCSNCKKRFNKTLVMLDFNQKQPKLVNVCPYCSTVLDSTEEKDSVIVHVAEHQKVIT